CDVLEDLAADDDLEPAEPRRVRFREARSLEIQEEGVDVREPGPGQLERTRRDVGGDEARSREALAQGQQELAPAATDVHDRSRTRADRLHALDDDAAPVKPRWTHRVEVSESSPYLVVELLRITHAGPCACSVTHASRKGMES